jgi:hypothetical protein
MTWETLGGALLTNAGTALGNATVPVDAPILPPQAFVDCAPYFISAFGSPAPTGILLASKGITSVDISFLLDTIVLGSATTPDLDFHGNALTQATANSILAYFASSMVAGNTIAGDGILDISGVNMATPTNGVANADAHTLVIAGWSVYINVGGVRTLVT